MRSHKARRDSVLRVIAVLLGVAIGTGLSYITYLYNLPIYLDSVGTIAVSTIGGAFPGIMTAVATDFICMVGFNSNAIYFCFINTIIAMYTARYAREIKFNSIKKIVAYLFKLSTIAGLLSGAVQWGLFGGPQNSLLAMMIKSFNVDSVVVEFILFICMNIATNLCSFTISIAFALFIKWIVPKSIQLRILNSGWRQKPLSLSQIKKINEADSSVRMPIGTRLVIVIMGSSIAIVCIMSIIGMRLYYNYQKDAMVDDAYATAKTAAEVIDADRIDEYIKYGFKALGYKETDDMLYYIWRSSSNMKYLYVLTVENEYVTYVFDVADRNNPNAEPPYKPGERVHVEETFEQYVPALLAGEQIIGFETDGAWDDLISVYYPLRNSNGRLVAYVGVDFTMQYLTQYIGDFMLRLILVLSGFFVMIITAGLWITGYFVSFPLSSMVMEIEKFIKVGAYQKDLDEAVKSFRSIDIYTGDEVQKLYQAICDMAANQAEQMRQVKSLSESTVLMQDGLIITMADLVENRDSDTGAHIQKTAAYVKIIVEGLKKKGYYAEKITPKFMSDVVRSAPLHDIGKINIPDNVLNKPGKLTDEEYEIIKTHTTAGRKIMEKAIDTVEGENYLKEARNMAAYHHERWDGKGYPEGLHGEAIPLSARIMAVADVFDALTSPRVYKPAFPLEEALEMIHEGAGTQFDAKCVEVFMDAIPEVRIILKKYNQEAKN